MSLAIVAGISCLVIFDLGRTVCEIFDLKFFIIVSFCFSLCFILFTLRVLREGVEEVDSED